MINTIKMTPKALSDDSRDYQLLARLYTFAFNYSKMSIDASKVWEPNIDERLALLRAYTLNFIPKHEWQPDILKSVTTSFKHLMKYKGSKYALEECIKLFARVSGINTDAWKVEITDDMKVLIYMTQQQATQANINDLLDYILPAGITYRVIEYNAIEESPFDKFNVITEKANIKLRDDSLANKIASEEVDFTTKEITDEVTGRTTQGVISNKEEE